MIDFTKHVDHSVIAEIEKFWLKINERVLHKMGVKGYENYDPTEPALGLDVEYFHFSICADDRMKYIGKNIVLIDDAALSPRNKLCNAAIAHLYGGRRIHTIFTGITDPKKAHLDFERINAGDQDYLQEVYANADYAKSHGFKFYGTTELHTSLQTAARNFCREKYNQPDRPAKNTDIVEWIAGWIRSGLVDDLLYKTRTLDEAYEKITSLRGVGAYYGYHFGVDCSLLHSTPYRHDEKFCVPGPGCQETLRMVFPTLGQKMPYGDAVVWIAEHQDSLFPNLKHHPALWNIEDDQGKKLFPFEQDRLMVYGSEVGLCQFSILTRLRSFPHLIEKRQCGSDPDLTPILLREQGNPILPTKKQTKVKEEVNTNAHCLLEF